MLSFLKKDVNASLQNELLKNYIDEAKIQKLINDGADINKRDESGRTILFELTKKKKVESIKILVQNGVNINLEDKYGNTVLGEAIHREDPIITRFLLENGASVNSLSSSGRTILQDVAALGNHKMFKVLMTQNPDLTIADKYGKTVLFDAVSGGNLDIIKEVLNNIDDVNITEENGQTALFYAVLQEKEEVAKFLISNGLNVNATDNNRQNVLFNAVIYGAEHISLIEMLLHKGLKLNQKDKDDRSILDEILKILAIANDQYIQVEGKYRLVRKDRNYLKLTSILIENGLAIDRQDKDGKTVLFKEVLNKNTDTIDFLISSGADVNAVDRDGRTVLFDAVLKGLSNISMIDYLIAKGADLNAKDNNELTVVDELAEIVLIVSNNKKATNRRYLDLDTSEDYIGLLKRILGHKPKINTPKVNGRTVLFDVIFYNNLELIKMLLNNGADANLVDIDGNSVLSLLIDEGLKLTRPKDREHFLERLVFLLKFRVNVNAVDKDGRTVYHKAVIADDVEVMEKLLSKRADLNIQDKQGRTALHHTQWKGNYKIARLLIAAGADMDKPDYAGYTVLNYAAILGHTNLVVTLIASGVLMYNHNKKSKSVTKFFFEREANLDKLLAGNITDAKMRDALGQVIKNLKKELREVEL